MANIVALDDGTWFDTETAERFEEATYWDGRNRVSRATGSPWDHQELYRTRNGNWILHSWSQWQGKGESWQLITPQEAASWLLRNGYDPEEAGLGAIKQELER